MPAIESTKVCCPSCESQRIWRDGLRRTRKGEIQRYICRSCGYRFSETTRNGSDESEYVERVHTTSFYSDRGLPYNRQVCVAEYEAECTREVLTDEEFASLPIRPCFRHVRENSIPLDGSQGHMMRIAAAMELATQDLSIASVVRWFNFTSDFDPDLTRRKVEELISYGYMDKKLDEFGSFGRRGFRCSTIQSKCADYCIRERCPKYRKRLPTTI